MIILEANDIQKSYKELKVIENISFKMEEGEVICLLGPSGCGKTTLLKMAAGLLKPDKGELTLSEGIRFAYAFQEPRLLPWKKVEENLAYVQQNFLENKIARELREELLAVTGLIDFRNSFPGGLSGGMKQRLELIRALSVKPQLLFLDEPFKSVDAYLKIKLRELLINFKARWDFSILLITHDPEEAVLLADRILLLSDKPASIRKEFVIKKERKNRSLKDEEIFKTMEELFEMVSC